ncbi:MAG: hypothetical protein LBI64_03080 [Coriobacteriales bacterium]|nr:hypothetical protein [Coriobacteriales bacterium]
MPHLPIFEALLAEHGTFGLKRKYFDEDFEVKPNAPAGLKEEIALLRSGKY